MAVGSGDLSPRIHASWGGEEGRLGDAFNRMLDALDATTVSRAYVNSILESMGDAVIVGHNVGFDVGFLRAACERHGRPPLAGTVVDTVALARRLLRDEVPNCKLGTLASRLRLDHQPSHRALDDALATADLLHLLIERASGLGVLGETLLARVL